MHVQDTEGEWEEPAPGNMVKNWFGAFEGDFNSEDMIFAPKLRTRLGVATKADAVENGIRDTEIHTRSLRAGGATELYTQGISIDIIQRCGRWRSLSSHAYFRRDSTALRGLSDVISRPIGLGELLRFVSNPKVASFRGSKDDNQFRINKKTTPLSPMPDASPRPRGYTFKT